MSSTYTDVMTTINNIRELKLLWCSHAAKILVQLSLENGSAHRTRPYILQKCTVEQMDYLTPTRQNTLGNHSTCSNQLCIMMLGIWYGMYSYWCSLQAMKPHKYESDRKEENDTFAKSYMCLADEDGFTILYHKIALVQFDNCNNKTM